MSYTLNCLHRAHIGDIRGHRGVWGLGSKLLKEGLYRGLEREVV